MPKEAMPWYRAGTDTWTVRIDGKTCTLARGRGAKAEAFAAWAKLRGVEEDRGPTLGSLADDFLNWCDREKAETTSRWYRRHLEAFAAFVGRERPCAALCAADFGRWVDSASWSRSTRHGAVTAVKRLFAWAVKNGMLGSSPFAGLERPGVDRKASIPTTAEVHELLDAATGPVRDYLEFLCETGCRQTEAHRLLSRHVDAAAGVCVMPGKTSGKTRRPRVIYLTAAAKALVERRAEGLKADDFVFLNRRGLPWTIQRSRNAVRCLRLRLGLPPHVTAGGIRHHWVTERIRAGVPIAHVAELAGHQSTAMISRFYGHLSDHSDDLRKALERRAG